MLINIKLSSTRAIPKIITIFCCIWLSLSSTQCLAAKQKTEVVEVGVLATRGALFAKHRWQPTMDWLSTLIPNKHFILKPLNLEEMATAVKDSTVDFIITNPGQAVRLGRQYSLSWMATMTSENFTNSETADSTHGIGSALVVRQNSPYHTLKELSGRPIAAVSKNAFGGYLSMRYQVLKQGLNPNLFFNNTQFLGFPIDANLYQLREGNIEAAVVPVCLMENMISEGLLSANHYRVIDNQAPIGFRCQVSTPLYSNWSFAKTERASSKLAKQMSQILFSIPKNSAPAIAANASGWTSPTSLLSIDKLYQKLDMHPLQLPWWKEVLVWLKFNQQWAWICCGLIFILNGYHFWIEYKFSRNKKQLVATLNQLKLKSEQLEHSQRIAVVGELGSSLAHEINQPLAAIRNYSAGGLLRLAKNRPQSEIEPVFEKIQAQVDRADMIIQRLRNMIKKRASTKQDFDIEQLLTETIELLHFRLEKHNIHLKRLSLGKAKKMYVDPIGLQQVIVNLINNATDACDSQQRLKSANQLKISPQNQDDSSTITLITDYHSHGLIFSVIDNGTGFQLAENQATQAFVSSKENGLGLGLAICQDVIEDHNGQLNIESIQPNGSHITVTLPFINSNAE